MTVCADFSGNPAGRPTMYFIGVSTGQSSIMKVFPAWAKVLGVEQATIKGIDFPLNADPEAYRSAVAFIKDDPLSLGALVTTHKIDLLAACRDMIDHLDPLAAQMGEVSCLSKNNGNLVGHAKDPITAGRALDGILGEGYFTNHGGDVFCIGAGGAAIAMTWHLLKKGTAVGLPDRLFVSDTDDKRLAEIQSIHNQLPNAGRCEYVLANDASENDRIVNTLSPHSVVVNATGLGKDKPGSPTTERAQFPVSGIAWDFNYRGNLKFLDHAREQAAEKRLTVVDGWTYFIHGWFAAIAEVFDLKMDCTPELIDKLTASALHATGASSR